MPPSHLSLPLYHIASTVPSMWPPSHYRLIHASVTASIVLFCLFIYFYIYLSISPNFLIPISSSPHFLHCYPLPSPLHIIAATTTTSFLLFLSSITSRHLSSSPSHFTHHYLPISSFTLPTIPLSPTPTCIYCYHHLCLSSLTPLTTIFIPSLHSSQLLPPTREITLHTPLPNPS